MRLVPADVENDQLSRPRAPGRSMSIRLLNRRLRSWLEAVLGTFFSRMLRDRGLSRDGDGLYASLLDSRHLLVKRRCAIGACRGGKAGRKLPVRGD